MSRKNAINCVPSQLRILISPVLNRGSGSKAARCILDSLLQCFPQWKLSSMKTTVIRRFKEASPTLRWNLSLYRTFQIVSISLFLRWIKKPSNQSKKKKFLQIRQYYCRHSICHWCQSNFQSFYFAFFPVVNEKYKLFCISALIGNMRRCMYCDPIETSTTLLCIASHLKMCFYILHFASSHFGPTHWKLYH